MIAHDALFNLPLNKRINASISEHMFNNVPILVINNAHCKAAISLQGAQLLFWQPSGQEPVIWLSEKAEFTLGTAIRGGIPICWPWFSNAGEPFHGFARNLVWNLSHYEDSHGNTELILQLKDSEQSRQYWPNAFSLIAKIVLGHECHVELDSHGEYSAISALHSYFNVSNIENVSVIGLGDRYDDKLTLEKDKLSTEPTLLINQPLDRIYRSPSKHTEIIDTGFNRIIDIEHLHTSDVVVWNPGAERALQIADMASQGYQTMLCVETARLQKPLLCKKSLTSLYGFHLTVKPYQQ